MIYAYDIESFKNLFTVTFVNVEDEGDKLVFYAGLGKEDSPELRTFLKQDMLLVGYNCKLYDDAMLRFFMAYKGEKLVEDLHKLSNRLVDQDTRQERDILALRYPRNIRYNWSSLDLMTMLAFDKLGISLKQVAINLKWYKIQDLPLGHFATVHSTELDMVLSYNLNDVLITKRLYETTKPLRELRSELTKLYHVDLTSASDSKIANLILENIYENELKKDIRSIKDMRTHREKVLLGNCVAKFGHFKSPELIELLQRIKSTYVYKYNNYKYSEKIYYGNCTFALGVGGLHSEDAPGVFVTDDEYIIRDMDVASYYPNLIINNNFYPQHLGVDFIKVLKKITEDRIEAKKSGDKVKADGLKITVNSIFGKLGFEYFWLLDAKQMLSTTLSGQVGLLMLIEDLHSAGIHVISSNTDGIVCKIPRALEDKYFEIAKNWEQETNLQLEFTDYKKYVRRDVNSYITEKADGYTKEKGAFLKEVDLKKAYHMPIVAQALYGYFIKGTPVRKTLEECKDIMDFCISQKSANTFGIELHTINGIEELQKTNRFYITKKGGALIKRNGSRRIGLYVGRQVGILNEYDPKIPFKKYAVDYSFYEKEVMKIIDAIEPKQMTMFDMAEIDRGRIRKAEVSEIVPEIEAGKEVITIKELNKLGSNQFVKRIEGIVNEKWTVDNISPRYVYLEEFVQKTKRGRIYSLAKGKSVDVEFDAKAIKEIKLRAGQLIYCIKFKKQEGGFKLVELKVVNKIEEGAETLFNS